MVNIYEVEDKDAGLEGRCVASGHNYEEALNNLVHAINSDEVNTECLFLEVRLETMG